MVTEVEGGSKERRGSVCNSNSGEGGKAEKEE
jgi:hypothetical protein